MEILCHCPFKISSKNFEELDWQDCQGAREPVFNPAGAQEIHRIQAEEWVQKMFIFLNINFSGLKGH